MSVLGALAAALGRARRAPRVGFTRLTTKQGPRTYYKGKGAASTGHHTSKGARGCQWRGRIGWTLRRTSARCGVLASAEPGVSGAASPVQTRCLPTHPPLSRRLHDRPEQAAALHRARPERLQGAHSTGLPAARCSNGLPHLPPLLPPLLPGLKATCIVSGPGLCAVAPLFA